MSLHHLIAGPLVAAALAAAARADDEPSKTQDDVSKLVAQIADADPNARDRAIKELMNRGPAALPELRRAAGGPETDIKRQATRLVVDITVTGRKRVDELLAAKGGPAPVVAPVTDAAVIKLFPRVLIFSAYYRLYPVARAAPEGLGSQNIFVVPAKGDVVVLTSVPALEKYFQTNLPKAPTPDARKDVARTWLRLTYEFGQDGFFKFSVPEGEIKADDSTVSGKVVVEPTGGNKGEISATLTFDGDGKLTKVTETRKLIAGPRPICQARKLLDPDPVVRRMAEDAIRVMGRAAGPYLDEQRADAGPELRAAIDRIWRRVLDEE
jgi:hypothetical protein